MPYVFLYDTYVGVTAETKEEADILLGRVEVAIRAIPGASLAVCQAWGCEDADTGEEVRPVT